MPDRRRRTCRECGRHESEVGPISWAGYCFEDGIRLKHEASLSLYYKRGPQFERWRRSMAACVGGVLTEDVAR